MGEGEKKKKKKKISLSVSYLGLTKATESTRVS